MRCTTLGAAVATVIGVVLTLNAGASAQPADSAAAESVPTVLYSGSLWKKATNEVTGLLRIVDRDGTRRLELGRDFSTGSAPDLKVLLSPHEPSRATNKNALAGGRVISLLRSNKGAQSFEIPDDVDFDRYKSVLIHCEQYTKLWGALALTEGDVVFTHDDWKKKTKRTKGRFEIARTDDGTILRFGAGFSTPKPPEPLRIVFSNHSAKDAKNGNAMTAGRMVVLLDRVKGAQEYLLPDDLDIASFNSLLLHCERYTKLWSAADIVRVKPVRY